MVSRYGSWQIRLTIFWHFEERGIPALRCAADMLFRRQTVIHVMDSFYKALFFLCCALVVVKSTLFLVLKIIHCVRMWYSLTFECE